MKTIPRVHFVSACLLAALSIFFVLSSVRSDETETFRTGATWKETVEINNVSMPDPRQINKYWHLIGPFPFGSDPLRGVFPPEERIDYNAVYKQEDNTGKIRKMAWQVLFEDKKSGVVRPGDKFGGKFVAYVATDFKQDKGDELVLHIKANSCFVIWMNGAKLLEKKKAGTLKGSGESIVVRSTPGTNRVLIKMVQEKDGSAFILRYFSPSMAVRRLRFLEFLCSKHSLERNKILQALDEINSILANLTGYIPEAEKKRSAKKIIDILEYPFDKRKVSIDWIDVYARVCVESKRFKKGAEKLASQIARHEGLAKEKILMAATGLYARAGDATGGSSLLGQAMTKSAVSEDFYRYFVDFVRKNGLFAEGAKAVHAQSRWAGDKRIDVVKQAVALAFEGKETDTAFKILTETLGSVKVTPDFFTYFNDICNKYENYSAAAAGYRAQAEINSKDFIKLALASANFYVKAGNPDRAVEVLTEPMAGRKVPDGWTDLFVTLCADNGFFRKGAEALFSQAKHRQGDSAAVILLKAVKFYSKAGDSEKAEVALLKIKDMKNIRNKRYYQLADQQLKSLRAMANAGSVLLPETMGIADTLKFIHNAAVVGTGEKAAVAFLAQMLLVADKVFVPGKGTAIDAATHMKETAKTWPKKFHAALAKLSEEEAARRQGLMEEEGSAGQRELWRFFKGTRTAVDMAENRAARLLDEGRPGTAALWYRSLVEQEWTDPKILAGYALSLAAAGDTEGLAHLRDTFGGKPVEIGGRKMPLSRFISGIGKNMVGNKVPARLPGVLYPVWTAYVPADEIVFGAEVFKKLNNLRRIVPTTFVPAITPYGMVINTGLAARCYDPSSGRLLWLYRPPIAGSGGHKPGYTSRPVSVLGVTSWDSLLFVRMADVVSEIRSVTGVVESFVLHAIDGASGKTAWTSNDIPDLKRLKIVSDPLLAHGCLYIMAVTDEEHGTATINAVCLRPDTGTVLWKRVLVSGFRQFKMEFIASEISPPLLTGTGLACTTNMGTVGMLDPLTGEPRWLMLYERIGGAQGEWTDYSGFHVNSAVYADNVIVAAPRDSRKILGIDAGSGKLLWETPAGLATVPMTARDGNVLFFGRGRITKIDLKTGKAVENAQLRTKGSLPLSFETDPYVWISAADTTGLFDPSTFKEIDVPWDLPKNTRVLPVGSRVVSIAPNGSMTVFSSGKGGDSPYNPVPAMVSKIDTLVHDGKNNDAAARARELLSKNGVDDIIFVGERAVSPRQLAYSVLGDGRLGGRSRKQLPASPADSRPILMWKRFSLAANTVFPEDYRGVFLSWDRRFVRLIDLAGFGNTIWELTVRDSRCVFLAGDTVIIVTPGSVIGVDLFTGGLRWKYECLDDYKYTMAGVHNGMFYCIGPKRLKIFSIDPASGKKRWESSAPKDTEFLSLDEHKDKLYTVTTRKRKPVAMYFVDTNTGSLGMTIFKAPPSSILGIWGDSLLAYHSHSITGYSIAGGKQAWRIEKIIYYEAVEVVVPRLKKQLLRGSDGKEVFCVTINRRDHCIFDPYTGKQLVKGTGIITPRRSGDDFFMWTDRYRTSVMKGHIANGKMETDWTHKTQRQRHGYGGGVGNICVDGNCVRIVASSDSKIEVLSLAKKTGEPVARTIYLPISDSKDVNWLYGDNFMLVGRRNGETQCFRMLENNPKKLAGWINGRKKAAADISSLRARANADHAVGIAGAMVQEGTHPWSTNNGQMLVVDKPWHWFPAQDLSEGNAQWNGPDDMSLTAAFDPANNDRNAMTLLVDIRDGVWEPFYYGDKGIGDSVVLSMQGLNLTFGSGPDGEIVWNASGPNARYLKGSIGSVSLEDDVIRYKLTLPISNWPDSLGCWDGQGPLTLIASDDDGYGVEGTMEWGGRSGIGIMTEVGEKNLSKVLSEFAPGWESEGCYMSSSYGLIIEKYRNREKVLLTHPRSKTTPCTLRRKVKIRAGRKTLLTFSVANYPRKDWTLAVVVDSETVLTKKVDPSSTNKDLGWMEVSVDLTKHAGKTVSVRLENRSDNWSTEHGYWYDLKIISK